VGVQLPHSRKQESEADHVGLLYMARAGYNPQEAVEFWKRFSGSHTQQTGLTGTINAYLSTHPVDADRIAQLEQLMPKAQEEYRKAGGRGRETQRFFPAKQKERPACAGRPFVLEQKCSAVGLAPATAIEVAATTAAAATTTTAAETAAAATAAGTLLAGTGFVDGHLPAVEFLAIEPGDGRSGLLRRGHRHKREATGLVGELVQDEFARGDVSGLLEQVEDIAFSGVKRQVAYE
jgi:hypothetical protein